MKSLKKIRPTTFKELTMNVFMLLSEFDPETFSFEDGIDESKIIASTTGGVSFADATSFSDLGDDIDNCPKNTMELKMKEDGDVTLSGNLVTISPASAKMLIGAAKIDPKNPNHIIPSTDLAVSDFTTLWAIADYGDGGVLVIKMNRILNTSGFAVSTTDNGKGQFAFTFTAHKTISDQTAPPYELWVISADDDNEDDDNSGV